MFRDVRVAQSARWSAYWVAGLCLLAFWAGPDLTLGYVHRNASFGWPSAEARTPNSLDNENVEYVCEFCLDEGPGLYGAADFRGPGHAGVRLQRDFNRAVAFPGGKLLSGMAMNADIVERPLAHPASSNRQYGSIHQSSGRGLPRIPDRHSDGEFGPILIRSNVDETDRNISPRLSLADVSRNPVGFIGGANGVSGFPQSVPEKEYSPSTYRSRDSGDHHIEPLRIKFAGGAVGAAVIATRPGGHVGPGGTATDPILTILMITATVITVCMLLMTFFIMGLVLYDIYKSKDKNRDKS